MTFLEPLLAAFPRHRRLRQARLGIAWSDIGDAGQGRPGFWASTRLFELLVEPWPSDRGKTPGSTWPSATWWVRGLGEPRPGVRLSRVYDWGQAQPGLVDSAAVAWLAAFDPQARASLIDVAMLRAEGAAARLQDLADRGYASIVDAAGYRRHQAWLAQAYRQAQQNRHD